MAVAVHAHQIGRSDIIVSMSALVPLIERLANAKAQKARCARARSLVLKIDGRLRSSAAPQQAIALVHRNELNCATTTTTTTHTIINNGTLIATKLAKPIHRRALDLRASRRRRAFRKLFRMQVCRRTPKQRVVTVYECSNNDDNDDDAIECTKLEIMPSSARRSKLLDAALQLD